METKDIILELRTKKGLSQEELAEKVFVTRQAVSRWETGETIPNTETLKLLSKLFDVSINTLLGSPRELICQCCGMPLEDSHISKETDGFFNEEYCKWCYADGNFCYTSLEELTDFLVNHMASENWPAEQARAYFEQQLPQLGYWKRYRELGGDEKFEEFKQQLIREFNDLQIEGMPEVKTLSFLVGGYINLEYRLPNGQTVKFLTITPPTSEISWNANSAATVASALPQIWTSCSSAPTKKTARIPSLSFSKRDRIQPIVLTRDMEKASKWLHDKVRGTERTGVLVTKSSRSKMMGKR